MRKTIKILSALLFSTISTGSIIACANPFVDPNVFRITIVTDGHTITDKSFNESAYNGALKFKSEFEQWIISGADSVPSDYKNKKIVITPIQPPTTELNSFIQSYGQAKVMNSKVTVAAGFIQNAALVSAQTGILKAKMRYIYVDGDTPNIANKDLAGLLYQAEQSGLMAALAAGVWLIANANQYGGVNNLKMSTYGGLNIPAVTNYMYGFYWGIDLLNNSETYSLTFNTELKTAVKILNDNFDITKPLPKIAFLNLSNQFTGNFDQASSSSKALNDSLVRQGTNVIFPVAGPQTSDTLSAIQSRNSKGKVIGVDTDQQLQYKESANYFLTSALKNIVGSVNKTLWQAFGFDPETHERLDQEQIDQIFKKNAVAQGGPEFTGIANNKAISPIYNNIVNSPELTKNGGFLAQVSQGWQQVLISSNKDYWDDGKKVNPFRLNGLERGQ